MSSSAEGKNSNSQVRDGSTITYTGRPLPKPAPQNPGKTK